MKTKRRKRIHMNGGDDYDRQKTYPFERRADCFARRIARPADKNIAVTDALNKTISGYANTQSVSPEEIATAARNAVEKLLEQRQRKFEQEEQEAKARGVLTPQECYAKLSADYADVLQKCIIVYDTYKYIEEAAKRQEARNCEIEAKLDVLIGKQEIQTVRVTKTTFPTRPKRFKDVFAYLFKDIPLYSLRWIYHSRGVRQFLWICLLFIWLISVAIACCVIHDNHLLRKEIRRYSLQRDCLTSQNISL